MFEPPRSQFEEDKALLIGVAFGKEEEEGAKDLLEELRELVQTLGVPIGGSQLIRAREPQPKYLIGKGKAEEVRDIAAELGCNIVIFDNELTPAQQRNWEALTKRAVIDRQEVILDIFAQRAQTREARIQIELARLTYSLPRLTRAWTHLGQQAGGIGTKGEGETQLELDRRRIREQIDRLKKELEEVRRARATQRKDRLRTPVPTAAIVGYTNAGKSSLLNRLTGANVLVEDKLFATLDTTTRKVLLPNHQPLLLTDTVGFVRKLPHLLVEAFHATLEEAVYADFLIHVLDASHPRVFEFYETTVNVLNELGAGNKEVLIVCNKMDKLRERNDTSMRILLRSRFSNAVFVSILTGEGMEELIERISELAARDSVSLQMRIPLARSDLVALLHREGKVHSLEYDTDSVIAVATVPRRVQHPLLPFAVWPANSPGNSPA
ncbi:MAG: GTPase HflX [Chthoniobacterales bacterium]|nr:GTPase HflX [Chthoniobacterales bacterium]